MGTINLGRVKLVNRGTWSSGNTYAIDDFVQFTDNGVVSTYIAVAASTNQTPSTSGTENSNFWKFLAKGVSVAVGNNKIVTSDSSGNLQGLSIGSVGTALKVTGANTLGFGTAGGLNQIKVSHYTGSQDIGSTSYTNTNIAVSITPTAADSSFYIHAVIAAGMMNHDSNAMFNVHDSQLGNSFSTTGQFAFPVTHNLSGNSNTNNGYMSNHWSTGSEGNVDDYRGANSSHVFGLYTPSSNNANARTFTVVCRTHRGSTSNGIRINGRGQNNDDHAHQSAASSYIMVWEVANGIFS